MASRNERASCPGISPHLITTTFLFPDYDPISYFNLPYPKPAWLGVLMVASCIVPDGFSGGQESGDRGVQKTRGCFPPLQCGCMYMERIEGVQKHVLELVLGAVVDSALAGPASLRYRSGLAKRPTFGGGSRRWCRQSITLPNYLGMFPLSTVPSSPEIRSISQWISADGRLSRGSRPTPGW